MNYAFPKTPKHYTLNKFGYNPAVSTAAETVWDAGGVATYSAAAATVEVLSSVAADTGIELMIQGLDANWDLQTVGVTTDGTDGTTPVAVSTDFLRIFRMWVSGDTAPTVPSVITCRLASGGATRAVISPGTASPLVHNERQTLMAMYSVPQNFDFYMEELWASVNKGKDATIWLRVREFGGVFRTRQKLNVFQAPLNKVYMRPIRIPEKSDIEVSAVSDVASCKVHAGFGGFFDKLDTTAN